MEARVFADGACLGNPGPGGWAAVVLVEGQEPRWIAGSEPRTTNNQMELIAAIKGIEEAGRVGASAAMVLSDSQYLIRGITEWIAAWRRNGWLTSSKQPVKNRELWSRLDSLSRSHQITWRHVRGHAGDRHNEECDRRANEMARQVAHPSRPPVDPSIRNAERQGRLT